MERVVSPPIPAVGRDGAALVIVGGGHDPARLVVPYLLEHEGIEARLATGGEEAGRLLEQDSVGFVIDLRGVEDASLIECARRRGVPVLVPAAGSAAQAQDPYVVAIPREALLHQLGAVVRQVRAASRAWSELRRLANPATPAPPAPVDLVLAELGPRRREVFASLPALAQGARPIRIMGPRGCGKRHVAEALHQHSSRRDGPLVVVDATDPTTRDPVRLASAHGGTLAVSGVEALPEAEQRLLLRIVEEKRIPATDGDYVVDAKLIVTVRDDGAPILPALRDACELVRVPALRDTPEDLPPLAHRFLLAEAERRGRPLRGLSIGAIEALLAHEWPGNLRELRTACEHAASVAAEPFVRVEDLPDSVVAAIAGHAPRPAHPGLNTVLASVEKSVLRAALVTCHGRLEAVGAFLRVPLRTLRRKCARHGLRSRDFHVRR